tara:strand:- start:3217 stop:4206 length:990 start_codon:yes stop_codon:yes gene_type:complete
MKLIMENWRKFVEDSRLEEKSRKWLRKQDVKKRSLGGRPEDQFGYVFGTVDGVKLAAANETQRFYGASMPKPILLLAAQEINIPVSDEMIKGLLNYVGWGKHDSNAVFSHLTRKMGKKGKKTKPYLARKGIAGDLASAEAPEDRVIDDLEESGRTNKKVSGTEKDYSKIKMDLVNSWSKNKQTPLEFFNFLVFLKRNDFKVSHPDEEIQQLQKVLSVMKREYFGESKHDRELKGFKEIERAMRAGGLPVEKVYGKGGRDAGVLNYGIIIDDQYIMSIYTDMSAKHSDTRSGSKIRKFIHQKIIDVYKAGTAISREEHEKMQPGEQDRSI